MPLSPELVAWLLQRGYEAVHAVQIGLDRASDEALVARAQQESRVIITADLDFPRMLALTGAEGPGLILFRGGNYSEAEMRHHQGPPHRSEKAGGQALIAVSS